MSIECLWEEVISMGYGIENRFIKTEAKMYKTVKKWFIIFATIFFGIVINMNDCVYAITTPEVEQKLITLINCYKDRNSWPSSYGSECYSFAHFVFNTTFSRSAVVGSYNKGTEYKFSTISNDIATIGSLQSGSSYEAFCDLLNKVASGDYLQVKRRSTGGPHSMIAVKSGNNTIEIFDANTDGKNTIMRYSQSYNDFYNRNTGLSVYRYKDYTPSNDTEGPAFTDFHVAELWDGGFTVLAKVTDPSGISQVKYAIWTENGGQDDLIWHQGTCTDNNDYYWSRITFSDHKGEKGKYIIHMYAYDNAGNLTNPGISYNFDTSGPTCSDFHVGEFREGGFTVLSKVTDPNGISQVKYAIWTEKDGQDDLQWYQGKCTDNNDYYWSRINFSDHKGEKGKYIIHLYAYDSAGKLTNPGISYVFKETGPEITNITVSDISLEGYTISCEVNDEIGINRVQFPTWTVSNSQDDLIADWNINKKVKGTAKGNIVTFRVNASEHNNEEGMYRTHIYAYDVFGNASCIAVPDVCVHDHNYGEWKIIKEATYTETGLRTKECTICGNHQEETISKKQLPSEETTTVKETTKAQESTTVKETIKESETTIAIPETTEVKNEIEEYIVNNITLTSRACRYDGTEKTVEIKGELPSGVSVKYEGNSQVDVGKYTVKAIFIDDSTGKEITSMTSWINIYKAINSWKQLLTCSDVMYGNMPQPYAEPGLGTATYIYSKYEDTMFTEEIPNEPGTYYVKAKVSGTDNYNEIISDVVKFNILPLETSTLESETTEKETTKIETTIESETTTEEETTTKIPETTTEKPTTKQKISISECEIYGIENKIYTGEPIKQDVSVFYDGEEVPVKITYYNNVEVGTATVVIKGTGDFKGSIVKKFKITKATRTLEISAYTEYVDYVALKKKHIKLYAPIEIESDEFDEDEEEDGIIYKNLSTELSSRFKINKNTGIITVRKGTKKGTYKLKIKVTLKGNSLYKAVSKKVTVKIRIS